ncbi:MAG: serine/threonine protein kinase [Planctomycetaceae bacterium]|nr:serine/threonine protein kinase [Planctomycetaceae bacterium]
MTPSNDDDRLFGVLDAYVASLQSEDAAPADVELPDELVEKCPELAGLLDCLDSLESVRTSWSGVAPSQGTPTLVIPGIEAGRPFGEYDLLEEIGRGGMGVVYRARHRALQTNVALKLIRGSQFAASDELRRFYQEARVAAGLDHPQIVRVHAVGEQEGQHFLAMDLVEGPNLGSLVAEGRPLDPARAAEIMADIANAVQFLHDSGLIHRDLKPSNVLLDAAGRPRLTDFGLIKLVTPDQRHTVSGAIIGTPDYMSPEQARGHNGEVTPISDIYGLGAVLYELLTGRPPFHEVSPLDTLLCVLEKEPLLPRQIVPGVPRDLEQICLKCLEKNPQRRYRSAAEVAADLNRHLKGEAITSTAPSAARRLLRWGRRNPALVSRLAGLAAAAVIVQTNVWLDNVAAPNHMAVMWVLMIWAGLSFVLQQIQWRTESEGVPFAWTVVDAASFTALVNLAEGPSSVLVAGYPLLIVASGLWFRVRLVTLMSVACITACLWLQWTGRLIPEVPWHYFIIVMVVLLLTWAAVAFQVYRIRTLNRYFDRQTARQSR